MKGREIASLLSLKHGIEVDKTTVNSLLYGKLSAKVLQNNSYQWSLKSLNQASSSQPEIKQSTPLATLANYYLDCISRDMDEGVSVFATSNFDLDYTQLEQFPTAEANGATIGRRLVDKVRNGQGGYVYKVGYPLLLTSRAARDGKLYRFVEPLFVFSVDQDMAAGGHITLSEDDPGLNSKAFKTLTGIDSGIELLSEIVGLQEGLGLNNSNPEDRASLEELALRLRHLRPEWPWQDEPDIGSLNNRAIGSFNPDGIYNCAAVFVGEKSKYTVGLEKDLKDLTKLSPSEYVDSALGGWINNTVGPPKISDNVLLEPIPLNEEQREAVLKGLESPLTVITGPPGTGKSQVVTNLIVNAVYNKQTVLFSSRNNKAVDVVNERVNALSNRQVMLRLGQTFQVTLSDYLSSLLSARPSDNDEARYDNARAIHEALTEKLKTLKNAEQALVSLRNQVDGFEAALESVREELGHDLFVASSTIDLQALEMFSIHLKSAVKKVQASDRKRQPIVFRILWGFLKLKRFEEAEKQMVSLSVHSKRIGLSRPLVPINDESIDAYIRYLELAIQRNEKIKSVRQYFNALEDLQKMPTLFDLAIKEKDINDELVENSVSLWNYWLQLLPNKLTQEDRRVIADYVAVLNLIVSSENSKHQIDRSVWARYYGFLPKIMHVLSCWAVTSLSARGRVPLKAGFFDLVVIDEASMCDIASALPLLFRAKRAVIIGDDMQLSHISSISSPQDNQLLAKYGLDENYMRWSFAANSLFRLAASMVQAESIVVLRDHHRSHGDIIGYSNQFFYENTLRVATKYEGLKSLNGEPAVRWIDVKGKCVRPASGSYYNDNEADRVVQELARIVATGYRGTIGVVTPFKAQYIRILDKLNQNTDLKERLTLRSFICDTVHKFQGDEKDIMIFSPVISHGTGSSALSFLSKTPKLFNVAITRARASLIVVGDSHTCRDSGVVHFTKFVNYVTKLNHERREANEVLQDYGPKYPKQRTGVLVSEWEKLLYETLYRAGIKTIPQFQVGQFSLDLALIDGERRLDIEVDGEKYHRNWDGELIKRDQLRNKRLIELGWDVKRFWVYQVRDNPKYCVEQVKDWLTQGNMLEF